MSHDPLNETIIDSFLEGAPRADQLKGLRLTLEKRLQQFRAELPPEPTPPQKRRLQELEQQVRALAEEEAVTRFVEDSVRATLARPHPLELDDDEFAL